MPDYNSIFESLGVFARAFSTIDNLATRDLEVTEGGETIRSLDNLRKQFAEALNDTSAERDALAAVGVLHDAAQAARGWGLSMTAALEEWIRGPLAQELQVLGALRDEVLAELARAMHADDESVQANDVSAGTPVAGANAGDAACYASGDAVDADENAVPDQHIRTQRVILECTRDNPRHRVPVGQEEFRVRPEHGPTVAMRVLPVTYGEVPDARNAVLDGAFEDYDGGFTHWDTIAGAGAVSRDTGIKRFGGGSLKITGDGATAVDLRQDMAARDPALPAGRAFALGAWVYVASHSAGSVVIDLLVDGQESMLELVVDGATPNGSWLHLGGFEYLPRASFPNKVVLRIACAASFDGVIHIDGVSLAPAAEVPHAGLRLALFEGAAAAQAGDRFTIDTSSDDAGAFQTFARDRLGLALPAGDTPSIDDSLAE